jgi:hypothetical protein
MRSLVEKNILVQVFPQTRQILAPRTASRGFCFCLSRRLSRFAQASTRKRGSASRRRAAAEAAQTRSHHRHERRR